MSMKFGAQITGEGCNHTSYCNGSIFTGVEYVILEDGWVAECQVAKILALKPINSGSSPNFRWKIFKVTSTEKKCTNGWNEIWNNLLPNPAQQIVEEGNNIPQIINETTIELVVLGY